jgi:hypothetical protein
MIEQDDRRCSTALVEVSTWFFGRLMALAAGLPTIFRIGRTLRPARLASCRLAVNIAKLPALLRE